MKKIIPLLFLFLTCFTCYLIYNLTETEHNYYLAVGDILANNPITKNDPNITTYNTDFINKDYRIIDIVNIIKYNEEITINNNTVSIHQLFKKSDTIILSIGMNDIYHKLNDNTKDIYTYINEMVNNMDYILEEISKYHPKQVLILGYYNITNKNNDVFTYLNYKVEKISQKYHYTFIKLNNHLKNNPELLQKSDNFYLNKAGYQTINQIIVENLKKY